MGRFQVAQPAGAGTVVLGIDPGTRVLGYGAVAGSAHAPRLVEAGVVRARANASLADRLSCLLAGIELLVAELRPEVVVVERAFAGRNIQSALRLGESRGLALAVAARAGARVAELSPAQAKRALVGHGAASKAEVARMVGARLDLKDAADALDATDALALALAWLQGAEGEVRGVRGVRGGALPAAMRAAMERARPGGAQAAPRASGADAGRAGPPGRFLSRLVE
jgi:crossover junction endodeoxyribonuclease RuvC